MNIYVVGSGKLATAILNSSVTFPSCDILKWSSEAQYTSEKAIIVHAGSGRELNELLAFCAKTNSVLIELSTGLETENLKSDFPLIICPNTSILMLKTLNLLRKYGCVFSEYEISITESHQAAKATEPGTAYAFAD
jgi:dihydrodipicolinate reductase